MSARNHALSPIEDIIEEARKGRMFVLVDDENRENEGDLVIPAQAADAKAINFMATHGRGLICLTLTPDRCEALKLPLMSPDNRSRHSTAFTLSIEAAEGVTTGISAADRATTIAVAIDPAKGEHDIATPGHVFPLMARPGGVLVRAGHTEAAVDISRLAGLDPSGVICEIMNDDGSMARLDDLIPFARKHGMKIGMIEDLIAYRRRTERLVTRTQDSEFTSVHGGSWRLCVYKSTVAYAEHVALVKGDVASGGPVPVRMHALNLLDDVLGDVEGGRSTRLHDAMDLIAREGRGVVVLLREPRPTALSDQVRARLEKRSGGAELRDYGVGAQILLDLGVRDMILLTNTQKTIIGIHGYGLDVVEQRPISAKENGGD